MDKGRGLRLLEHTNRVAEAQGAILAGANLERSKLAGIVAVRADFTDAILKDAKLVRANLKQASMGGANLAGADLSGADLSGADLRDSILVGATIYGCNITDAKMEGALTDTPMGQDVTDLPYDDMIAAHALWCETGGAEGHALGVRRRQYARAEIDQKLQADGRFRPGARYSTASAWKALGCRAPIWRARICATAICAAPTLRRRAA